MTENFLKEKAFEDAISGWLTTHGGYQAGNPDQFNRMTALDEQTFLTFVQTTQPQTWKNYSDIYQGNAPAKLMERLSNAIKESGLLSVLRKGFKDRGLSFKACFFKPDNGINPELIEKYDRNILHCTRQLHYSPKNENSIDIVLFLNGIPVVSMELKCQFTGQDTLNAIRQYKFDRAGKEAIFDFKNRVLVHFAVDLEKVFMTTRLEGASTYFLPFNQGDHGAGNVGGAGNPVPEDGDYMTAYLWKRVLTKDVLMEILHKYMQIKQEKDKKTGGIIKETMIFPRYHQLDVVTKLLADVKERGSGKNYLIQHSAGSGKSNSIAWLAYRLSGLHNKRNEKIFHSVIIVTDRKVLDQQLQETIAQFDHTKGSVETVDKNSQQLLDALNCGTPIIVTTLQKFPVIFEKVKAENKRFAVIVDEAHSSQTGNAAKKLKQALADTEEELLEAYARSEAEQEEREGDDQDRLVRELLSHGQHKNLSFFAFTATPKAKTLQMFGEKQPDGTFKAFHVYSMRQAIEEGFILDVLKNYTTYRMYYKIAKQVDDNPVFEKSKGTKEVVKYQSLHPYNIAQKTAIMVEHFHDVTRHKIGGRAKAMVVTSSRLHAIKYLFAFRDYIKSRGYKDLDVLVAFSQEIEDGGKKWTEESLNKDKNGNTIRESQLKDVFHTSNFNMLIVAEKYQTGFDEPLLHTMFVDKKLADVKAVQTLSRLNRTMKGKEDTFILDFVNSAEDIQKAFQPFYEQTVLEEETDPNVIYTLKNALDKFGIYFDNEVENFADTYYGSRNEKEAQARLTAALQPALERFQNKEEDAQNEFRSSLGTFIRIYSFIIQVCRMFDKDMQKFYVYAKALSKFLPRTASDPINLNNKIVLDYYRLEKESEASIQLKATENPTIPNIKGGVRTILKKEEPLSVIIDALNKHFGTDFTEQDKVLAQIQADMFKDQKLVNAAKNDNQTTFDYLYEKGFLEIFLARGEQNNEFFQAVIADDNKQKMLMSMLKPIIYEAMRTYAK